VQRVRRGGGLRAPVADVRELLELRVVGEPHRQIAAHAREQVLSAAHALQGIASKDRRAVGARDGDVCHAIECASEEECTAEGEAHVLVDAGANRDRGRASLQLPRRELCPRDSRDLAEREIVAPVAAERVLDRGEGLHAGCLE